MLMKFSSLFYCVSAIQFHSCLHFGSLRNRWNSSNVRLGSVESIVSLVAERRLKVQKTDHAQIQIFQTLNDARAVATLHLESQLARPQLQRIDVIASIIK